ncbi:MAG: hypothetical protein J5802_08180 [Butyrivibrio sp.]|nr:hypothetical protein [Butyrivibrio sp.]
MIDFVCHTAPLENAIKIFKSGALQAPTKWRGVPASVLKEEFGVGQRRFMSL